MARDRWDTVVVGGIRVARLRAAELIDHLFDELAQGRGGWLLTANLDFVQRAAESPAQRALNQRADVIVADGVPLLWAASLQGRPLPERIAGSDLVWSLAERAAREHRRLFLLGGDGDAAVRAAAVLCGRYPGLQVAGTANPWIGSPPKPSEVEEIRETLAAARPDIVYVAFGSPKTEYLIGALCDALPSVWLMGCGISLSFVAGLVPRAPRWMQRVGLEWFHRLMHDPRRLARRYLGNLSYVLRLLRDAWAARRARRDA